MCMISDPYAAGYTFARSAFTGGPTRDQKAVRTIYIPYSGYFTWGLNFVVFVVGKQNTKISDTKIKCTVPRVVVNVAHHEH